MTYFDRVSRLYSMINKGQLMEAFEQFYDDNIIMIEATGDIRVGKTENRKFEQEYFDEIREISGGGVTAITANETAGITMVESWREVVFKDGSTLKLEQVSVQNWKGEKIIKERFYFNPNLLQDSTPF